MDLLWILDSVRPLGSAQPPPLGFKVVYLVTHETHVVENAFCKLKHAMNVFVSRCSWVSCTRADS